MYSENSKVIGAFSEEDAARLSGVSISQLKSWDRAGFLEPSFSPTNRKQPYSRIYSFRDLVSLRVLNLLRNTHGVSLQHLKKVGEALAGFGEEKWIKTTLYVLGKRVVFDDPLTSERKEVVGGQRVFDIPLRAAISDTLQEIRRHNSRSSDEKGHMVQQKFLLNNQRVFTGTRVPVVAVQNYLSRGASVKKILEEFPDLSVEDVEFAKDLLNNDAA